MCLLELSLNLKNRLKVYSGQDSFILIPAATLQDRIPEKC